jgi:hypothetical protein
LFFQVLHLQADGWLGDVESVGCSLETSLSGDGFENPQLI